MIKDVNKTDLIKQYLTFYYICSYRHSSVARQKEVRSILLFGVFSNSNAAQKKEDGNINR